MFAILKILFYLKSKKVIHRNLKLSNLVLVNPDSYENLMLVDFSYSMLLNSQNEEFQPNGSPGYMAPEVINDSICNYNSDIFNLGCIFHILVTGKPLFNSSILEEVKQLNKKCQIDFTNEAYKSLHKNQFEFLKALLAVETSQRLPVEKCLCHPYLIV